LLLICDGEPDVCHHPFNALAVRGMAIAAPCKLEENAIIDPRADAADAGVGENVQTSSRLVAARGGKKGRR
jgi:hypothetical protein